MATSSTRSPIQELRVQETDSSTVISIEGSREPDFTVFKLNDPLRVVIDLANAELGQISGPFAVRNGTINEVNTTQFEDASSSISRIIIGFDQVVDYEVVPEGNRLKVNVQRIGPKPAAAQDIVARNSASAGAVEVAAADSTTPPAAESGSPSAEPGMPAESTMESTGPTNPASQIVDVKVMTNPAGDVEVEMVADGKIGTYNAFRLDGPTRVVVDFPGLTSGLAKKRLPGKGPVKTVRLGPDQDKLRIVLDGASSSMPEFQATPSGDRLLLTFGGAPAIASNNEADDSPAAPVPAALSSGSIAQIKGLDFTQLPSASRIMVKVADTVSYQSMPYTDGKVIIELVGATISKPLQRALDTSEFDSPVLLVSAIPQKGAPGIVRVEVKLREDVPVNVTREDGVINIDFERTRTFVAAAVAPAGAQPVAPAAVEAGAAAPPLEEAGSAPIPGLDDVPPGPSLQPSVSEPAASGTLIGRSGVEAPGTSSLGDPQVADILTGAAGGAISGSGFSGRRISLDLKDADIKNIFRLFAEISKLNIIVGDNVSGKVTLRLVNVPWDQAFAIVLQTKKLGIVRYDNILRIAPLAELERERKEALSAKEAERDLEDLKVLVLPINYTKADDLKTKLSSLLSKRGKLTVDSRTNTIILEDIQEVLVKARALVKTLDTQTNQVVIDARVVQARRNWQRSLGIQWGGSYQMDAGHGNPTGLAFPAAVGIGGGNDVTSGTEGSPRFPGFSSPNYVVNLPAPAGDRGSLGLSLGSIADIGQLDLRLSALEDESKARVISSPRVTTMDNISATISQGTKIPYATISASGTQTTFVDATLSLNVTPHVTNDGFIDMKLDITNNAVGANTDAGPSIDIAQTGTQVLVKDGDTTVIGGVYILTDNWSSNGLPWLGNIPGLKLLFSNYDKRNDRAELLFFITPRIVRVPAMVSSN